MCQIPYCKAKHKEGNRRALRKFYAAHKEQYIERNRGRKAKIFAFIREIKERSKCAHCGMADWRCLDFHHKNPKQKEFAVSSGLGFSKKRVLKEIKKCIILCANCHRKLEYDLKHKRATDASCTRAAGVTDQ